MNSGIQTSDLYDGGITTVGFSNQTREEKKLLRRFIDFHWEHYRGNPQYVPLLDYEYLGLKIAGITGFFEPHNLFYRHAEIRFFIAYRGETIVGRTAAFVNHDHNDRWNDAVGFFGQFESIEDQDVTWALLDVAKRWLKSRGMDTIRGPQNFPVNEATPGVMTDGFESRPVIYYHYNKPYYADLIRAAGMYPIKRVFSWEVAVNNPFEEKLIRVAQKVIDRFDVTIEKLTDRSFDERKREMLEVYNDAWSDNFGFVPFREEEFFSILDDMKMIMDKELYIFLYVRGELAAFFGGVPNIFERMTPHPKGRHLELFRAAKVILTPGRTKGFRLGYLGVKRKFRRIGLDGVMLWKQKNFSQKAGYEYSDMGWVLEGNAATINLINFMSAVPSKTYTLFEQKIQ